MMELSLTAERELSPAGREGRDIEIILSERELRDFLDALPAMINFAQTQGIPEESLFELVSVSLFDAVRKKKLSVKDIDRLAENRGFLSLPDEDGTLMVARLFESGYRTVRDFPDGSPNRDLLYKRNKYGKTAYDTWMKVWSENNSTKKTAPGKTDREFIPDKIILWDDDEEDDDD